MMGRKLTIKNGNLRIPTTKTKLVKKRKVKGQMVDVPHWWCKNHRQGKGMWVRHNPAECKFEKNEDGSPSLVANHVSLDQEQE